MSAALAVGLMLPAAADAAAVSIDRVPPAVGAAQATAPPALDAAAIIKRAAKKAVGGGKAGAAAAVAQVLSLMWLRTAMNYQYRYGGSLPNALGKLYGEGGVGRLYEGLPFALVQGPLSRFGDTVPASNRPRA